MKIEPIGYVYEYADYTMSIVRATPGEYAPHAVAVYTEAQLRQAMEACAAVCESRQTPGTESVDILNGAADEILEMIKEMLP